MSITVSAFYPDMQLRESNFCNALTRVAMNLAAQKQQTAQQSRPEVEVAFLLTGRFDSPGFTGMRIKTFDSQQDKVLIETAVPEAMNESSRALEYIIAALLDAVDNAAEFLAEIEISFDHASHTALINKVADATTVTT